MASIRWLMYKGKRVLLLDFSQRSVKRMEELTREKQQVITGQDPASVLVLADFTGTKFDEDAVELMGKVAAVDRPYIRRAAWVGTESLPEEWFQSIQNLSQREIHRFATREEALDFLAQE